ncbi:MAG: molybdenum ABC transporter ATP-binding protein [Inquilinaceae bacterium]
MSLDVAIRHRFGALDMDVAFSGGDGLTALFGRSGAGKSSIVNVIGGLVRPVFGRVVVDGDTLLDTERGVWVPPHRRRVGYVFQDGRLFPHLTVRQNLFYGRWFTPRSRRYGHPDDVIALLGLGPLLDRQPARLSGGEKQRVAIGRALLASPRLLLMDEPLASLDDARKGDILPFIERLRDEFRIPIVYVSHSVPEVARLAGTVVVVADGKVAASGGVTAMMQRLDLFPLAGAADAGAVLDAVVAEHDRAFGLTVLRVAAGTLLVPRLDRPVGSAVRVQVRARDVMVATRRPEGLSALNILPATVAEVGAPDGATVQIRLDCAGDALLARLTRRSVDALKLAPGVAVFAVIKSVSFDRGRSDPP